MANIDQILQDLALGQSLTDEERSHLIYWTLTQAPGAQAFGITSDNVERVVHQRSLLYPKLYLRVQQFWRQHCQLQTDVLKPLWVLWLPLALRLIAAYNALERPLIQGILGLQGVGKTTLTQMLKLILEQLNVTCLSLSIDDLYLTYAQRQQLRAQDPRLIWRGPPGTHDVQLGIEVLDQLRSPLSSETEIAIPRFDKSAHGGQGDRLGVEWGQPVDVILFEGWFVGVRPIDPSQFETAPVPINSAQDQQFARDLNAKLRDYLPLWERLDHLIVLNVVDYRLSKQWRQEAEHRAIAAGKSGMSDAEIEQFVDYFWRALHPALFVQPLIQAGQWVDLVIEIDAFKEISSINSYEH